MKHNFNKLLFFISFLLLTLSCASLQRPQLRSSISEGLSRNSDFNDNQLYYPLKKFRISRGFSPSGKNHFGVDFVAPRGTKVFSSHSGKVIYSGSSFSGYGKLVIIEHPDGFATFYAHLHERWVKEGQLVNLQQVIGTVGRTGRTTGVHLHFELRVNKSAVDPIPFLKKMP
ncbi:MAG: M23 family metallopeptidase [Bdellovibrionales bacterium]